MAMSTEGKKTTREILQEKVCTLAAASALRQLRE
jgi:hypothetical protein